VPLPEQALILELLFQFTTPQVPPDIEEITFPHLLELAQAAEKYVVHSAIRICIMKMK